MRCLIIEDDPTTARYLSKGLTEAAFVTDTANDGDVGLRMAQSGTYDIAILDLMLPGRDGFDVLAGMRRAGTQTPVIILTARDGVEDRVRGLNLGADDYLVKPFAFSELLARLRSVLRRGSVRRADTVRVADLEIDLVGQKATRGGVRLDLTQKEFLLLSLLARRRGEVLSRTVIAQQVWDLNFDAGTNVIDVHIRRLRAKVDDPFHRRLIHTVRGAGYVLDERP